MALQISLRELRKVSKRFVCQSTGLPQTYQVQELRKRKAANLVPLTQVDFLGQVGLGWVSGPLAA